jgi:hypothetical protein
MSPERPPTLTYDDLPPGSALRREYHAGGVRITVPGGEPSEAALRDARQQSLIFAAAITALLVLVAVPLMTLLRREANNIDALPRWLVAPFGVCCAAAVLLIAHFRYAAQRDLLEKAHQSVGLIEAGGGRLRIETAGPEGEHSYSLARDQVKDVRPARRPAPRWVLEMSCLAIERTRGPTIHVFPGRTDPELRWIASSIRQALQMKEC